jgi:flagellar basal body-associated protein FliL
MAGSWSNRKNETSEQLSAKKRPHELVLVVLVSLVFIFFMGIIVYLTVTTTMHPAKEVPVAAEKQPKDE